MVESYHIPSRTVSNLLFPGNDNTGTLTDLDIIINDDIRRSAHGEYGIAMNGIADRGLSCTLWIRLGG